MKQFLSILIVTLLIFSTSVSFAQTVTIEEVADDLNTFYTTLANIIEKNIDDPNNCINEVGNYYQNNQAIVANIKKYFNREIFDSDRADVETLLKRENEMAEINAEIAINANGYNKYILALQTFSNKHPKKGSLLTDKFNLEVYGVN